MKPLNGNVPIRDLDLSTRGMNALLNEENFVVVDDIRGLTDAELLQLPNFGKKALKELRAIIGPMVKVDELLPVPPPPPVIIKEWPTVHLTWQPQTGLWRDNLGNDFNLWRVSR